MVNNLEEQSQFEKAQKEQETKRVLEQQRREELRRKMMQKREVGEEVRRILAGEKESDSEVSRSPRAIMARLRALRQLEMAKAAGEVEASAEAQQLESGIKRLQNIYRIINGTSAITLVGLIITFLVMNAQLIFGNWLKVKFVPPLSLPEIIIILVVDFLVGTAILIILGAIAFLGYIITHPEKLAEITIKEVSNRICKLFGICH